MRPRLRDLVPFIAQFRFYAPWIVAGLALSVATLAGSLGLLGLSGGFLTATGIAGLVPSSAVLFNVVIPAGGIRLFALTRTASRWGERVMNHEATFRLLSQWRVGLYERLSRLSPRQLGLWHGGEVLNRMTKDVDQLDNLFIRLLVPISAATIVLGAVVGVVAFTLPEATGLVLSLALFGLVLVPLLVFFPGKILAPRLVQAQGTLRRHLIDGLEGMEEWILHRPAWERQKQRILSVDAQRLADQVRYQRLGATARAVVSASVGLGVWLLIWLVSTLPEIAVPDGPWFVAMAMLLLGTGEALAGLPAAWAELPGTALAARRLRDLSEQKPNPAPARAPRIGELPLNLTVKGLSFSYDDDPLLEGLDWELPIGTHAALLGPSGQGKTTLVRLLTRLEDPAQGQILFGGLDLREWDDAKLRTVLTCSMQDPWIFTATLADNLRLAGPDAPDEDLWRALEVVGLAEQIRAWPTGLETWIEEGGQSLSGGQRRRLSLARLVLKGAPVTLVDEPTEGLDEESARTLVSALRREFAGRTLVWITHRPEGLDQFDQVWRLQAGRLVSTGPSKGAMSNSSI